MATRTPTRDTGRTVSQRQRLIAGLRLTERRLELSGVSTAVLEAGDGPPLVLIHGGIECGGAYWAPVVAELAGRYRIVVPDLPGLGESEPAARRVELAFPEWFSELLHRTCADEPSVVAHSLGGGLVARFAAEHGGLRRLVLYGSPAIWRYRMPLGLVAAALRFDLRPTLRNHERFERWAFLDVERTRLQDPDWFQAFAAYCVTCATRPHVKQTMRRLVRTQTERVPEIVLRRIGVHTTLVWGRRDRMVPLDLAEEASSTLEWPLHVVEDAGHVPHLERPATFVRALTRALTD
jgi:2-hydroxymuconate-semialdehyde hydrolase